MTKIKQSGVRRGCCPHKSPNSGVVHSLPDDSRSVLLQDIVNAPGGSGKWLIDPHTSRSDVTHTTQSPTSASNSVHRWDQAPAECLPTHLHTCESRIPSRTSSRTTSRTTSRTSSRTSSRTLSHTPSRTLSLDTSAQPGSMYTKSSHLKMLQTGSENSRLASIDPPITKCSLGELDFKRIINDPKLRHDLNFEREIAFRPNYDGPRGVQKKATAKAYWEALAEELAQYFAQRYELHPTTSCGTTTPEPGNRLLVPSQRRLPQMFRTIKAILKSLVPETECFAIDQTLDVDFLLQQLEKGVCDLVSLSNWLGKLLMGSCSPCRDPLVRKMVETIQEAASKQDARGLVDGIEQLFVILETMKLDVANHQIRALKVLMFEDSVQFERRFFEDKINLGLPVANAWGWYQLSVQQARSYEEVGDDSNLDIFTKAVIDLVIGNNPTLPDTFLYDIGRLQALQADFQISLSKKIHGETFIRVLEYLGHSANLPLSTYDALVQRISKLEDSSRVKGLWSAQLEDQLVLEIVRTAYNVCKITSLPTDEHVTIAKQYLEDVKSLQHEDLECELRNDLEEIVDRELSAICHLTPLQIQNHYQPNPMFPRPETERDDLWSIGERLAHIIVLHWRIWAPILYLKPWEAIEQQQAQPDVAITRMRRKSYSAPDLGLL